MADPLAALILEAEQELTDLKTAHRRGLGMVSFYSKTASVVVNSGGLVNIRVYLNLGEGGESAVVELGMNADTTELTEKYYAESGTHRYITYRINLKNAQTVTAKAISNVVIKNMICEVV